MTHPGIRRLTLVFISLATAAALSAPAYATATVRTTAAAPIITTLSRHAGTTPGGTRVRITGKNLSGASSVQFGTSAVRPLAGATATALSVVAPPHPAGVVNIRVVTKAGRSAVRTADRFTYQAPTPRPWITPKETESGGSVTLSCVDDHFCMDVDQSGAAHLFNGASWSPPVATHVVPQDRGALDCLSHTFCILVGSGKYATYDGEWHVGPGSLAATDVSCVRPTLCLARNDTDVFEFNGTSWGSAGADHVQATHTHGLACVPSSTQTFCLLAGDSEMATLRGTTWTSVPFDSGVDQIACASTTMCVAKSSSGTYRWINNSWESRNNQVGAGFGAVSCASNFCAVISTTGVETTMMTWTRTATRVGSWMNGDIISVVPNALSCVRSTWCINVDTDKFAWTYTGTVPWSKPVVAAPAQHNPRLIACSPTTSLCAAADARGNVITYTNHAWSTPYAFAPGLMTGLAELNAVNCVATTCMAVGGLLPHAGHPEGPTALAYTSGRWHALTAPAGMDILTAVTCVSAARCIVGDTQGDLSWWNGSGWTAPSQPFAHGVRSISCGDASHCLAADGYFQLYKYANSTWTTVSSMTDARTVACTSATWCTIGTSTGVVDYNGSDYTTVTLPGPDPNVLSADCATRTYCVAASQHTVYSWDGTRWTTETNPVLGTATSAGHPISSVAAQWPQLGMYATDLDQSVPA